ncbi:MAG TPA: undecaprenyl-diphosphate phosphatase [Xanthomonadaceae bacterium]|nr:undecaprenyl-diphosphate phosphatase [Xanthomonadaceae bacterium]
MDLLQILVLALIQALTEFLPISSSAHLVLASHFVGWDYQGLAFDLALHVGTLLAVLVYFRRDFLELLRAVLAWRPGAVPTPELRLALALAIGTLPAAIAGVLLGESGAMALRQLPFIALNLVLFGLLLWQAERRAPRQPADAPMEPAGVAFAVIDLRAAALIGCAQALALMPGVSRSGVTMTAALMLGLARVPAARFAFLLSAPIMLLAGGHAGLQLALADAAVAWDEFALGTAVSAVAGIAVIHGFLGVIRRIGVAPFVIYRLLLGAAIVAWIVLTAR